jgi:hypothetical protein
MKKLSIFDRKFLRLCHIGPGDVRVFHDDAFRQAIGVAAEDGYATDTSRRLMELLTQPPVPPTCALDEAEIQARADRIAQHTAPLQLDGTQQLLVECGFDPYNRADYLRLTFAGNPPAELDGEIEAELPDGIRLEDDEEDEED